MVDSPKTSNARIVSITKKLLIIASVLTITMAIPHFFVPFVFPWERLTEGLYPPVKWALFAMNFFFSLLLLWGGFLSLIAAVKPTMAKTMQYIIFGGIGLFWVIGSLYEIIFPFPIAEAKYVLPGMALSIACLYGAALLLLAKRQ